MDKYFEKSSKCCCTICGYLGDINSNRLAHQVAVEAIFKETQKITDTGWIISSYREDVWNDL